MRQKLYKSIKKLRRNKDFREEIVLKVGRLLSKHGYYNITMDDISKKLGISKTSIYYHFNSKNEIIYEFHLNNHIKALNGLKSIVKSNANPETKLRRAIKFHIGFVTFEETPGLVDVNWQFFLPKNFVQPIRKIRKEYDQLLREIIHKGVEQGVFAHDLNIKLVSYAIVGALNFIPQWYSPKGTISASQIKNIISDYLINGLLKR